MKPALLAVIVLWAITGGIAFAQSSPAVFETSLKAAPSTALDKIVLAKLKAMNIEPVICSDAVFVRRAYIDVIGTLPTAEEARAFIEDQNKDKRKVLIDRLLERDEFADYWSMKWGDILRIKAEFPVNLWPNAAQAYARWVRSSIAENKPYDQFARELLTSSGSNFRVGPVNFYRAIQQRTPEGTAGAVALTLMGSRIDGWKPEVAAGTAQFFSQIGYKPTREWKEEIVFWDPLHASPTSTSANAPPPTTKPAATSQPIVLKPLNVVYPDGTRATLPLNRDPREMFADWLINPKNPWFTRAISNRVWWWLMGRGIVHEPDDIRPDNPPVNAELIAYLEKELVNSKYDLKQLYRTILNSQAYQLSSVPKYKTTDAEANFASYPLRRLEAEVLIDAINRITGSSDLYTSAIPEPFTYIPKDKPSIAIADGSITSPFLALFGRSARATGMENERNNKVVSAQWLHLLNSSHIQRKIDQGAKMKTIIDAPQKKPNEIATELYLTILSRFPTEQELKAIEEYGTVPAGAKSKVPVKRHEDWVDIAWALMNSSEFLYRH